MACGYFYHKVITTIAKEKGKIICHTLHYQIYHTPKMGFEPHISAETLEFHHDKHHAAYVNKLNELLPGSGLEGKELMKSSKPPQVIAAKRPSLTKRHKFGTILLLELPNCQWWRWTNRRSKSQNRRSVWSVCKIPWRIQNAAVSQFGSGWAWLVADSVGGQLSISKTANADTPLAQQPSCGIDMWRMGTCLLHRLS